MGAPRFALSQFNAQADAYWYAFTQNAIVVKQDDQEADYDGQSWYVRTPATGQRARARPTNFPQHGRIKMLASGNQAVAYLLTREPIESVLPNYRLPRYIRLGKWMSKAALEVSWLQCDPIWQEEVSIESFLNPVDLPDSSVFRVFDLVSVHPVPLIRNTRMRGWFYRAPDGAWIPAKMRFGVDKLPDRSQSELNQGSSRRRSRRSPPNVKG
jgi:CRISPR-associated protein Csc1